MIDLVLVNALEAPRSAVGAAARVTVQEWEGSGADVMEAELHRILSEGAVGTRLTRGIVAWPPPEPVVVVRGDEAPEVLIGGAVDVVADTLASTGPGCTTRSVQITVTTDTLRVAGATISDRLGWSLTLRDTACGGLAPKASEALVEEALRGLAPEVAALVLPRWTVSEVALLRTPATARGNRMALGGDWAGAGEHWANAEADPACVFNQGVKAELEGQIPLALQFYDEAAARGVIPAAAAADRAEARAREIEGLRRTPPPAPDHSPRPAGPIPEQQPLVLPAEEERHQWTPPAGATLAMGVARMPQRGRFILPTPAPVADLTWEGATGTARGLEAELIWRFPPRSPAFKPELRAGGALFPGEPTAETVQLTTWNWPKPKSKIERVGWVTFCPIVPSFSIEQYRFTLGYGLGVGGWRHQPYLVVLAEEPIIEPLEPQRRGGLAVNLSMEVQLSGRAWNLSAQRVDIITGTRV